MRCFIAIDINDEVRAALADLQEELGERADVKKGDVKWVRPESVHLTLKFLGEVKDARLMEVCNIVEEVCGRHKSFELDIEQVGCFGGRSARVVWVGTGAGGDSLKQLAEGLEEPLAAAGWPKEGREFAGHLTICRVKKSSAGVKLAKASEEYKDFKAGMITVDSVSVYQSELTPKGPIYTVLANFKLK
ncbi:MAG: RNA 2',3'-cyclic phosphodiesterase [Planctomycetota bacterium]|nr:MAG: RNA 2',3'-cyclic phosphodiesterase [Planctomycetota bacterium]